jgi:uncharacterized membrane protein
MKTSLRVELPQIVLLASMFVLAALTWPHAPERIPVHWDVRGEVNGFGGKVEGLLLLPLIALAVYLMMRFLPVLDPGRANYPTFAGAYAVIRVSALVVIATVYGIIHLSLRGHPVRVETVMPLLVGGLFVVLGGVLGKIRPNWFVGVRTPWTLSSKRAWTQTHRVCGFLFVASGLLTMAAALVDPRLAVGGLVGAAVLTPVVALVYSYRVWKADPDKVPPAGTLPADES